MGDNDQGVKRKIAELEFGTQKAEQDLKKIEKAISDLNKTSDTVFGNIQNSLNNSFSLNVGNVNIDNVKKTSKAVTDYAIKQTIRENTQKRIEANKTANEKQRIDAKTNANTIKSEVSKNDFIAKEEAKRTTNHLREVDKRETAEYKANLRNQKNTKSIYDQIANYAKTYLIYQGFNEIRQAAKELVSEMVNVEYQMVQIDRVLNDSSLNINDYRDKLIQLAYDYGNSFENVADITLRLAQAGFDAQESLALTEKTLLALNTAELNATQATSDMVAIMAQWGLNTGDAADQAEAYGGIIDRINKVADQFPTTSEDILNALKKTSSAFNLAGASIDETIALITTAEIASQRGGKAIGTAMNNIITQLKDDKRLNIMESLGIDIYADEAKTEFNSIIDIITQLSEKMQQLTADGKENSTEMQELLSVFTVFRRNIGAGLLTGVAGEDSTYEQVLATSLDSLGYSMEENEKHMKTAKAALEQFNAELLKLKTNVWDNGGEDVFRGLLVLGTDLVKVLNSLVETFGTVPTVIGVATLAFSMFNKQLNVKNIFNYAKETLAVQEALRKMETAQASVNATGVTGNKILDSSTVWMGKLGAKAVSTTAGLIGAKVAAIGLQAALSLGLSAAITLVLKGLDALIVTEKERIEQIEESIRKSEEQIGTYNNEKQKIDELIDKYQELNAISKEERTQEQSIELQKMQTEVNSILKAQGEYAEKNNLTYEQQIEKLREISDKHLKDIIEEQEYILRNYEKMNVAIKPGFFEYGMIDFLGIKHGQMEDAGIDIGKDFEELTGRRLGGDQGLATFLDNSTLEEQITLLTKWKSELKEAEKDGKDVAKAYEWVTEQLYSLNENNDNVIETQTKLNELYSENSAKDYFKGMISNKDVDSLDEYKKLLIDIAKTQTIPKEWIGTAQQFRDELNRLAEETYPELSGMAEKFNNMANEANSSYKTQIAIIENVSENYTTLSSAMEQYNKSGEISIDTFNNLVNNDLLQYLDLVDGKLKINEEEFLNSANAAKEKAKADLQEQAAAQILSIVVSDLNIELEGSKEAGIESAQGTQTAAQACLNATKSFLAGTIAVEQFNSALKGEGVDVTGISKKAKSEINSVISNLNRQVAALDAVSLKAAKASSNASGSATKTFKEQSEERVKIFKEEIEELESLEESWVKKYKALELFGSSDLKFITHQRINRYKEYLNQIRHLQGISEEDRLALTREYQSKLQEVELEYFDILKDELEDQIDAYEEANKAKIEAIEAAADAEIEALKKVEAENDRIREKEEYERKRNELIYGDQGIEYWRQRTGREAQQALMEAEKELKELDEDWNEKKEEWTLEDQIEEIEKARDAQVKAIEDAQEIQIEAWRTAYQEQVNLYAQTGQIIYDGSVINAGYLYQAYMDNFVTPFHSQLQNVVNSINSASRAADNVISKMNTINGGGGKTPKIDTSKIPKDLNLQANIRDHELYTIPSNKGVLETSNAALENKKGATPSLINMLKKRVGKYHGGGFVKTAADEALAIVRKNEVVLTPEWAAGMNKLVNQINQGKVLNNSTSTSINIEGNLINLDNKINNQQNADYLTKKIEKVLEDKFNIKK